MAGKNVLVITGSPRVDGNSDRLADAFIDGAVAADNNVVRFDAGRMNIGPVSYTHLYRRTENGVGMVDSGNTV